MLFEFTIEIPLIRSIIVLDSTREHEAFVGNFCLSTNNVVLVCARLWPYLVAQMYLLGAASNYPRFFLQVHHKFIAKFSIDNRFLNISQSVFAFSNRVAIRFS